MAFLLEQTLQGVIHGDQVAFAELYNHYRTPALRFCTSILKDEEEAENILHEVFIKIWERRAQINPELNFNSYLFTCLRNLAFDYLRKMEKSEWLKQQYLERMEATREEDYDVAEARLEHLQAAIGSLSEKRRQILRLTVEKEMSYQEISDLLRISKNTVKNQLVKARQFLREKMEVATLAGLVVVGLW
ncbi:RNA polymerase sigma factor [Tellurirhabdus rosea]|uniref:RNA polymerase sigma factor n=1 Tax=Tellurirhabdus rosea TaxID=2674997 RepID=UPI00224FF8CB|nr:RNA polymerase sigma-70 factor [Tellurirhabdus rosea]